MHLVGVIQEEVVGQDLAPSVATEVLLCTLKAGGKGSWEIQVKVSCISGTAFVGRTFRVDIDGNSYGPLPFGENGYEHEEWFYLKCREGDFKVDLYITDAGQGHSPAIPSVVRGYIHAYRCGEK